MKRMLFLLITIGVLLSLYACEPYGILRRRYVVFRYVKPYDPKFLIDKDTISAWVDTDVNSRGIEKETNPKAFEKLAAEHGEYGRKEFIYSGPGYSLLYDLAKITLRARAKLGTSSRDISQGVMIQYTDVSPYIKSDYRYSGDIKEVERELSKLTKEDLLWITADFHLSQLPPINEDEEYVLELLLTDSSKVTAVGEFRRGK